MEHGMQMLKTHPQPQSFIATDQLGSLLSELADCAVTCTICADACLAEQNVARLLRCIRLNQDCADVCQTTARLLARHTESDINLLRQQLEACTLACQVCGEECAKHAERHEHCGICAEACRHCGQTCQGVLGTVHV